MQATLAVYEIVSASALNFDRCDLTTSLRPLSRFECECESEVIDASSDEKENPELCSRFFSLLPQLDHE